MTQDVSSRLVSLLRLLRVRSELPAGRPPSQGALLPSPPATPRARFWYPDKARIAYRDYETKERV
jgi:hypothetical protein